VRGELLGSVNACFPRLTLTLNDIVLERSRHPDCHLTTPLPRKIAPPLALSAPEVARLLLNHFHPDSRFVNPPRTDSNDVNGCIHFSFSTRFISTTIFNLCQQNLHTLPPTNLSPSTIVTTLLADHTSSPGSLRAAFAADSITRMMSAAHRTRRRHHLIVLNATKAIQPHHYLEQLGIHYDTHATISVSKGSPQPPHQDLCTEYLHHLKQLSTAAPLVVFHGSSMSGLYPLILRGTKTLAIHPPKITLHAPVQSGSWTLSPDFASAQCVAEQKDVRTIRFACIDTVDTTRISLDLCAPERSAAGKAFHHILTQQRNGVGLLDAAAARGFVPEEMLSDAMLQRLCTEERVLVTQLCLVYEAYSQAQRSLSCRPLSRYLVQLANVFERFYLHCPVFGDDPAQNSVRTVLCKAFTQTVSLLLGVTGL
jgi:hypothetical protein